MQPTETKVRHPSSGFFGLSYQHVQDLPGRLATSGVTRTQIVRRPSGLWISAVKQGKFSDQWPRAPECL